MDTFQRRNIQFGKGDLILSQNQSIESLYALVNGSIDVFVSPIEENCEIKGKDLSEKSFKIFSFDKSNVFLGLSDLFLSGKYTFSYRAAENSTICSYTSHDREQMKNFIADDNEFASQCIDTLTAMIDISCLALEKLEKHLNNLGILTDNLSTFFWLIKEKLGFSHTPSSILFKDSLETYQKLKAENFFSNNTINFAFIEKGYFAAPSIKYLPKSRLNITKIKYYSHLALLNTGLRKSFFSSDPYITRYHCEDASNVLLEIQSEITNALKIILEYVNRLYSENEENIFSEYLKAALEIKKIKPGISPTSQILGYIVNKIKETVSVFENEYNNTLQIDLDCILNAYNELQASNTAPGNKSISADTSVSGSIPDELKNSALKIIEYSNIPKDRAHLFLANLEAFRNLKDKNMIEGETVNIKNTITPIFFEIYESVFKRAFAEKNNSKLINMFLTFAYVDEKLLNPEHTLKLYELTDTFSAQNQGSVYSMKNWLTEIYTIQKDPSINEFGQDYFEVFREMKKHGQVTDKDKPAYDNDINKRLNHEIFNMFRINQKVCSGLISSYFPILHNDMISARDLSKVITNYNNIKSSIDKILGTDFSAFHREISYINPEKSIEKELIMKSVMPDFVLMPIFGSRGIMWQEITGRNRSTPGRFIIPVFTNENIYDILLKLTGNFRWELCRTMMGISWNDITLKSLTSEYTDYIQFFKKNTDLSEDAKEKIKAQIQKFRNMLRDIFTSDYETWVNHESKGAMRLNKVVRAILYKNCPFSKPIRDQLERQPAFNDISVQFKNTRAKHARELENHYKKYIKSGESLDSELEENLKFYRDM